MKKKIIALLLSVVALLSFVLVGCSKDTSTSTDNKEETKQEAKKDDKKEESKKFNYIKADELKSKIEKKEKEGSCFEIFYLNKDRQKDQMDILELVFIFCCCYCYFLKQKKKHCTERESHFESKYILI